MLTQDKPAFSLQMLHDQLWYDVRQHRDTLLNQADIQINKLEDNGEDAAAWRTYRKALRDLPQATDNPTQVVWPTKP